MTYKQHFNRLQCLKRTKGRRFRFYCEGLEEAFQQDLKRVHKRLFPNRKFNVKNIPDHIVSELYEQRRPLARKRYEELKQEIEELEETLNCLARDVDLTPADEMRRLATSTTSDYHTQTNPTRYAKGALEWKAELLKAVGFDVEIRTDRCERKRDAYGYGYTSAEYSLWANCEDWQFDAVLRGPMTVGEWVDLLESKGLNPRVYNPFIPYNV